MRLGGRSTNIEDRRGIGGPVVGGGIGMVVLAVVVYLLGGDPSVVLQQTGAPSAAQPAPAPGEADPAADFVSAVLADTEQTWSQLFAGRGQDYPEPTLVLFSGAVRSACGAAGAAVGPFYCPADQKVYIDLSFYRELKERFGAPGDAAQAYVIAHEVGHHVQNVLGISDQVHRAQQRAGGEAEANALSVRLELQADCLAGVWVHHADKARRVLEPGDVEEALGAAAAIGDDRLQREARGRVAPESFTHGTSAQRMQWFRTGLDTGSIERCDTFARGAS